MTLRFSSLVALVALAVFLVTRLALTLWTGIDAVPLREWPAVFALGLWFDLAALALVLAPIWLHEALVPDRWRRSRAYAALRLATFGAAVFALLFVAVAEATFWLEFATRFNFIAVDYLLYTHEVIGNIRESYPVGGIVAALAILAGLLMGLVRGALRRGGERPSSPHERAAFAAAAILAPVAALTFASVDQMGAIGNTYADELAGNGLFSFAAAARRNELDYDRFYATIPQPEADRILIALGVERKPLDPAGSAAQVAEHEESEPHTALFPKRPKHVVLVTIESLSAEFLGAYGSQKGLTPNLDAIARAGLVFANVYATGTRTVRGLEAVSLGIPPVPGQAIVRRPDSEHLATIGELLEHQGFATSFVYGGYGYFDNMNAYFGGNDYRVVDRTDFARNSIVFENVWGVADESLFDNALAVIDANVAGDRRSFTHVMTTSNHRPFTYPQGRIDIASPGGRDGAVKYTDWAIGRFVESARAKPWFGETLFVFVADHCASVAGKTRIPVGGYRIPMIFYAPGLVQPGVHAALTSQLDLPPTLLDVLRVDGDDYFFGRSVFELPAAPERAFLSNYQSLGYLRRGVLTVLSPGRKVEAFSVDSRTLASTPIAVDQDLANEAIAYYQTASRAFRRGALRAPAYARR